MRTPPPGGARDRGGELEAAEAGVARAMQADGVRARRRPATSTSPSTRAAGELAGELRARARRRRRRATSRFEPSPIVSTATPSRARPSEGRLAAPRASRAGRTSAQGRRCRSSCSARARRALPSAANRDPRGGRRRDRRRLRRRPAGRLRGVRAAQPPGAVVHRRRPPPRARPRSLSASTTSFPVTPGTGCSRAG